MKCKSYSIRNAVLLFSSCCAFMAWTSCRQANAACVDLSTGEDVTLVKDSVTGEMINTKTGRPVTLYVESKTRDTIYGPTGEVVNNKVIHTREGGYVYEGDRLRMESNGSYSGYSGKTKNGDYKRKVEDDGDVKIKNGDTKIKIDGETGERKVK